MKLSDLRFDLSGQSQELRGSFTENTDPKARLRDAGEYICWIRRMRHYPVTADEGRTVSRGDAADGQMFLYWIVGEDGELLSSAVRNSAVSMLMESRRMHSPDDPIPTDPNQQDPEESDEDYSRRTNHGTF